jgi:hypothetical protein
MGIVYDVTRTFTGVAGNDILTFAAAATKSFRVIAVAASGQGVASAANDYGFFRTGTLGVTGSAPVVPTPKNTANGAFGGVVNTAWTTQPIVGAGLFAFGVNSNGGVFSKTFTDAEKIDVPGGVAAASSLSFRQISGTGAARVTVTIEEF